MSRQRGFTLIEMAFVIAIIGLMVGGGIIAIGPILYQAKINQTNAAMDQVEAALAVFAIRNNRLPCPADGSLTSGNTNYGIEAAQANNSGGSSDLSSNNCQVAALNAVIPWRTLGLDETYSIDGWSSRFAYFPAVPELNGTATQWNTLVDNPSTAVNCLNRIATTTAPPQGFRSSMVTTGSACDPANALSSGSYGAYSVPTYPFGNYIPVYNAKINPAATDELTVANPGVAGTAVSSSTSPNYVGLYGQRAAYVLISHGPLQWYGWNKSGNQIQPPGTRTVKAYNSNGSAGPSSNGFVQGTPMSTNLQGNADYFDDIVRWRSPAFVIQNCGSGACGNP